MNFTKLLSVATAGLLPVLGLAQTTFDTDTRSIQNNGTTSLSLAYFDSTLGTLTGVNISVGMTLADVNVKFDNDAIIANTAWGFVNNVSSSFGSSSSAITSSISPIATASDFTFSATSANYALGASSGDNLLAFDEQPGQVDYAVWAPGSFVVAKSGAIAAPSIASYIGSGDFNLDLRTFFFTAANFTGTNGRGEIRTGDATFTATVTYTYIPEPSTYALILGALTLGMIGWRRFRK